jgi:type VI secretion system secreted protein Hcp
MVKRNCLSFGLIIVVLGIAFLPTNIFAEVDDPISEITVCLNGTESCFKGHAVHFGASQAGTMHVGGGGGAGKVKIDDISILRSPDSNSPNLFRLCASGRHLSQVVITIEYINDDEVSLMKLTLTNVLISKYSIDAKTDEIPTEVVDLDFAKVCLLYGDETNEVCWNIEKNNEEK